MKLRGQPPTHTPTLMRGRVSIRYRADGKVVWAKWPRRRPGVLPPITQQQVKTWDEVQEWVRFPEPLAYRMALDRTKGTAFYARDVLIMAAYGHYISWPGWGIYPQGQHPLDITARRSPGARIKRRRVGDPQPTNALTSFRAFTDGETCTVKASTQLPANPQLGVFCCNPNDLLKQKLRGGTIVPHGYRLFFDCEPTLHLPTEGAGQHWTWRIPQSELACPDCNLVLVQLSDQPHQDWTSLNYPCPDEAIAGSGLLRWNESRPPSGEEPIAQPGGPDLQLTGPMYEVDPQTIGVDGHGTIYGTLSLLVTAKDSPGFCSVRATVTVNGAEVLTLTASSTGNDDTAFEEEDWSTEVFGPESVITGTFEVTGEPSNPDFLGGDNGVASSVMWQPYDYLTP